MIIKITCSDQDIWNPKDVRNEVSVIVSQSIYKTELELKHFLCLYFNSSALFGEFWYVPGAFEDEVVSIQHLIPESSRMLYSLTPIDGRLWDLVDKTEFSTDASTLTSTNFISGKTLYNWYTDINRGLPGDPAFETREYYEVLT